MSHAFVTVIAAIPAGRIATTRALIESAAVNHRVREQHRRQVGHVEEGVLQGVAQLFF